MKKLVSTLMLSLTLASGLGLTACSNTKAADNQPAQETKKEEPKPEPLKLDGTWKTEPVDNGWMQAEINADTITVYFVVDGGDTKSLYWKGTYEAPTEATTNYSWTSKADTEALKSSLFGSSEESKDFKYDNGTLSFEATAMGTTKTMKMTLAK